MEGGGGAVSIEPDGLTGSLLAVESITDARVILNGPGGCRNYHSFLSELHYPRPTMRNQGECMDFYFFGQPRVPCSYLDEDDYIRGSLEKMGSILPIVKSKGDNLAVVINSPGAALIGDDLDGAIERAGCSQNMLAIDESFFSTPASTSYDSTIRSILSWLDPPRTRKEPATVNILGLSITSKDWQHGLSDLTRSLATMGLKVIAAPGVACTVEQLRSSVKASYNIVVSPEYGLRTAELYQEKYDIPYVMCPDGAPVGFDATESWLRTVASSLGTDPSEAVGSISSYRQTATRLLREFQFHTSLPKGMTFGIKADSSIALPLTKWLLSYLGMVPVAVRTNPGEHGPMADALRSFLNESGFGDAWGKGLENERPDVVIADGHTARLMKGLGSCLVGVDIGLPSLDRFDFVPRSIFGAQGAMYLLDEMINGL
jgi:nitrogenase molybdenum-iron protein alpha/beta subunit